MVFTSAFLSLDIYYCCYIYYTDASCLSMTFMKYIFKLSLVSVLLSALSTFMPVPLCEVLSSKDAERLLSIDFLKRGLSGGSMTGVGETYIFPVVAALVFFYSILVAVA